MSYNEKACRRSACPQGLGMRLPCNRSDKVECVVDQACISGAAVSRSYTEFSGQTR